MDNVIKYGVLYCNCSQCLAQDFQNNTDYKKINLDNDEKVNELFSYDPSFFPESSL